MEEPNEWAEALRAQLLAWDHTQANVPTKKTIIKQNLLQACRMVQAQPGPRAENRKRQAQYTRAIKRVAREVFENDIALRRADLERRYEAQATEKRAESEALKQRRWEKWRRKQRRLTLRAAGLPRPRIGAILLIGAIAFYALLNFAPIVWHGMTTGELVYRAGCRLATSSCITHIPFADQPVRYVIGMALFLGVTLLCVAMLCAIVSTLFSPPKDRDAP
ncbi:hypothetical protein I5T97_05915 [Serratia marcescens]|nr:hypothetical protein [Serratia marcescens]